MPFVLAALVAACVSPPTGESRRQHAETLAAQQGWQATTLTAGSFNLLAYLSPQAGEHGHLTVYIEGDGLSWITGTLPSDDPTPTNPVALELALAQPDGNAVYLARPCQYVGAGQGDCRQRYWTTHRFSPEVVAAMNAAIDGLKQRYGARSLTLAGYSGGGTIAALVAARRHDVVELITVTGNLDHRAWSALHHVSPLTGSLNPADETEAMGKIVQWHFVGGKDTNVPPALVQGYAERYSEKLRPHVHVEAGFDHRCCWAAQWARLWRMTRQHQAAAK